jgi:signal transduction histidine kinase
VTISRPPERALLPELRSVARFGARQLKADGIVVLDERSEPARLVACEGARADELVACLPTLPSLRDTPDTHEIVYGRVGDDPVVSAAVSFGEVDPIGTIHVLRRGLSHANCSDTEHDHVVALALHTGLVLTRMSSAGKPGPLPDERDWLDQLNALPSLPDAISRLTPLIIRGLREDFGATTACLVVWDSERSILRALPGAFGTSNQALSDSITAPPTNPQSLASRVFATGQPYVANTASRDPSLLKGYVEVFELQRVLAVPLTTGTHGAGVLILANKPDPFTIQDVVELEQLAPRIATRVRLTLLIEQIRRSERVERILAQTATEVASGKPLAACLTPALRALGEATGSSLAVLSPRDAAPVIWRGEEVDPALEQRFMDAAQELAQRRAGAFPQDPGDPGWAAAHAPAMFSGEPVAAVSLLRLTGVPFGTDEAESLSRLAGLAALAWAAERYQSQEAELALARERARIADQLHDDVAQILFAAQIGLDSLLEHGDGLVEDSERIIEIRGLLTKGEAVIRDVINECARVPEADLIRRLHTTVEAVTEQFRAPVELELPPPEAVSGVARPVSDCLVKVAHEATINAAKHAGRCTIRLRLSCEGDSLRLEVLDDGRGLPPSREFTSRHGLASLRRAVSEAGGALRITPESDTGGTVVSASFPREVAGLSS